MLHMHRIIHYICTLFGWVLVFIGCCNCRSCSIFFHFNNTKASIKSIKHTKDLKLGKYLYTCGESCETCNDA